LNKFPIVIAAEKSLTTLHSPHQQGFSLSAFFRGKCSNKIFMNDEKLCYLYGAKEKKGAQDTHKERLFNYTKGKERERLREGKNDNKIFIRILI
jgi:hypothetical protein